MLSKLNEVTVVGPALQQNQQSMTFILLGLLTHPLFFV